ncbi:MAG: DivIVA domain-containing protein [Lachnospiraceae bacterium]|nr:DivIVA domain-containing protein [Lachnospiraceae bacterium]
MITPIEIQKTEFKMSVQGYSKTQVDEFKAIVLKDYETLYRQSLDFSEKIDQLNEKIGYYENMEQSLHKALVLAEKSAEETRKTAELNAEAIEKEARAEAANILVDAKRQLAQVYEATRDLVRQYETYRSQFIAASNAQIQLLNSDSFKIDMNRLDAYKDQIGKNGDEKN